MANKPKNRLEIQVVWPGGYWRIQGPDKGAEWSHATLIEQLERAIETVKMIASGQNRL